MEISSSVGKRIKNRRLELGLTVEELADRLGKNRATVYRYESDAIENLPITVIEPLAAVLDCTPGYLMGWEDINNEPAVPENNELTEMLDIFSKLTPDNRAKLLELSHLYLDAQHNK